MSKMKKLVTCLIWGLTYGFLAMTVVGCERKPPAFQSPQHNEPKALLLTPMTTTPVETTADALPVWRDYSDVKPVLVIFSSKTLKPAPRQVQDEVSELLLLGSKEDILTRMAWPFTPDSLARADMAVAAAMHEKYFSRVVWVLPVGKNHQLTLETFVQQLRERAEMWGEYIDTFKLEDGHITGQLDGVPVDVVTVEQLPELTAPILLHIDTAFFQPLYAGEVKTPLFGLMRQLFMPLQERRYQAWAVTFSRDTLTDNLSLDTRFVADEMARFLAKPELVGQIDKSEELRRDALYLVDFFRNEEIFKRYHELKTLRPEDASVRYGEYKALRELRQPDNALAALAQAVALDPVYAYEYQELADMALGKDLKEKALELLDKAIVAVPNDPFLRLQKARMFLAVGRDDEGKALMQELSGLPWSPVYYPDVRAEIERLY